jgi:hypothetical protein
MMSTGFINLRVIGTTHREIRAYPVMSMKPTAARLCSASAPKPYALGISSRGGRPCSAFGVVMGHSLDESHPTA